MSLNCNQVTPLQEEPPCAICLENISEKNSCITECGHMFCCNCLLQSAQTNTNCPLCRNQLVSPPSNEITQHEIIQQLEEEYNQGFADGEETAFYGGLGEKRFLLDENATLREKLEKLKKYKKKIKEQPNMVPSEFEYFKSHPDSQDAIIEASKQLQGEWWGKSGDSIGTVKGAGMIWSTLSDDVKKMWKLRALESVFKPGNIYYGISLF